MAPKSSMSQAQKLEKFLMFFRQSKTCHALKDLESIAASATKINKMQIKDLLKELTDTNQVKVEKIGSGNWYWAWAGEEVRERKDMVVKLQVEENALLELVTSLQSQLDVQKSKQAVIEKDSHYDNQVAEVDALEAEVRSMRRECDDWKLTIANRLDSKRLVINECRSQAIMHTDSILTLEAYIQRQIPVSPEEMDNLRFEYYGKLYREGEGLADVEG